MPSNTNNITFLTTDLATPHGFFTRKGGVTAGHLGGLNCGSAFDTPENIRENQRQAMQAFGGTYETLSILKQVHSNIAHVVQDAILPRHLEGDALVTNTPGMVLGVLTADCVPVFFYDAQAGVIGAAHAGWKGALYGVVENTLAAMEQCGAQAGQVQAAIGACIRQPSYEVGAEYKAHFIAEDKTSERFFIPSPTPGHAWFDLPGYVAQRLQKAGVAKIDDIGVDTRTNEDQFFSCRRAFLKRETGFGNGLSAIRLVAP